MTDWATRVSTADHPMKEMQASASCIDEEATIPAIRKIIQNQEHLLPQDVVDSVRRRNFADLATQEEIEPRPVAKRPGVLAALRSLRR